MKRGDQGFTLVEVMMSAVIALLILSSIGSMLDNGVFLAKDNRSRIYAMNAIREELETLRRTGFGTIESYGATSTFTNAQITKLRSGTGTRSIAAGAGADIKKVTLTVSWTSRNGRALTESLTTYITRSGINGL